MKTQDGATLFPLQTRKLPSPTHESTKNNIDDLFSMFHQQRYLLKKTSTRSKEKDTRSKARPGFRKGKWTDEESKYAELMAYYFKEGLLPLEKGTMLRMYLAEKLNCEPMRITKKFTGDECIGKQIFRPLPPSSYVEKRIQDALGELQVLEKAFHERIEEMPMYCMSTKKMEKQKRTKKNVKQQGEENDTQAASLLLGFFNHAHTNETAQSPQNIATQETPSLSPKEEIVYRSKRKFSISHCISEYEIQRPRLDSFSLVTSN